MARKISYINKAKKNYDTGLSTLLSQIIGLKISTNAPFWLWAILGQLIPGKSLECQIRKKLHWNIVIVKSTWRLSLFVFNCFYRNEYSGGSHHCASFRHESLSFQSNNQQMHFRRRGRRGASINYVYKQGAHWAKIQNLLSL